MCIAESLNRIATKRLKLTVEKQRLILFGAHPDLVLLQACSSPSIQYEGDSAQGVISSGSDRLGDKGIRVPRS